MAKWEYKRVSTAFELKDNYLTDWLNKEGQEGWEAFECIQSSKINFDEGTIRVEAIFKRKIED